MGLRIVRESRSGAALALIDDPTNRLHRLLPMPEDLDFLVLNKIDLYGDTIIEHAAIGDFRKELARVVATIDAQDDRAFLGELDWLAASCEVGDRLVFVGD